MSVSATILALSLITGATAPAARLADTARATPARQCVSADRTGTFRVTTQKAGAKDVGLGLIVLENIDGCLEATFITDNANPANIDGLSMAENTLKGALRLNSGSAKVTLRFDGSAVAGSITQGRNEWTITGRRTS